jgi:hypothetical protein
MTCLYGLVAGEYSVFLNEAYYANRTLGPMLSITFILLMNLIAFSIIIAMVEDAYEIAKARGKTKKGLDPLLVQLILGLRVVRNCLEKLPCCPCIRKKYQEVLRNGKSHRRGLKRDCTVLDLIKGSKSINQLTVAQILYREIINPYAPVKRLYERKSKNIYKDIIQQEENLRKARMLLIEKTVLEMSMRLTNTKDEEVITLEDVTQVHFANLQKEKSDVMKLAKQASEKKLKRDFEGGEAFEPVLESAPPSMLSHFHISTTDKDAASFYSNKSNDETTTSLYAKN